MKSIQMCKRNFSWLPWNKSAALIDPPELISREEEMKVLQYRGRIDNFNQNARQFELYLRDEEPTSEPQIEAKIAGHATPEGTLRFKERALAKGIPAKNFRKPYPLPGLEDPLELSTVGVGSYLGKPDDEDDFDQYVATRSLLKSSTINFLDTAINYRCQKAERTFGAVLRSLMSEDNEDPISRDEIFVASKNGYIPEDADNGIPSSVLIDDLIEKKFITEDDIAGGIHCMHPKYLEHQLEQSRNNLGLETIDLMYLHNSFESQAHYVSGEVYFDRLAKAFEFYEQRRQAGDIKFYGMATWLCFRAKPDEENIYLNFQKCVDLAKSVGGEDNGFRFV